MLLFLFAVLELYHRIAEISTSIVIVILFTYLYYHFEVTGFTVPFLTDISILRN